MNDQLKRININSGTTWELQVGYSRAVKVGPHIYVSGTTATDETGQLVGINDAYLQTIQILNNIKKALNKAQADLKDVVRTRIYVTDINLWPQVGQAHNEFFASVKPASSMIEVSGLIDPNMLVEIEVEAFSADTHTSV